MFKENANKKETGNDWINALANRYLKDVLKDKTDYFERQKIRITFNISVLPFLLLIPYAVSLIISELYFSLIVTLLIMACLITSILLLRYKKQFMLPAKFVIIASFLVLSTDMLFSDTPALVDVIWYTVIIFYTFFTLGKNWGKVVLTAGIVVSLVYIKFRFYDNFHNESIYTNNQLIILAFSIVIAFLMTYFITAHYIATINFTQAELKRSNEELQSAKKELESFSYSVSHDLRAPLRSIDGYTRIIQEDYKEKIDEEGRKMMETIMNNVKKINVLIDAILKFSRQSRQTMSQTAVDMNVVVNSIVNKIKTELMDKKTKFEIKTLPKATGDLAMMTEVFQNLIMNAVKYSSKKENPKIEIGSYSENNKNVYFVKDNGAGFDMAYYDKMFSVFQRFHRESEFEGVGISLAITKRLIQKHGGEIWAEGKVGEGASFYFSLPKE